MLVLVFSNDLHLISKRRTRLKCENPSYLPLLFVFCCGDPLPTFKPTIESRLLRFAPRIVNRTNRADQILTLISCVIPLQSKTRLRVPRLTSKFADIAMVLRTTARHSSIPLLVRHPIVITRVVRRVIVVVALSVHATHERSSVNASETQRQSETEKAELTRAMTHLRVFFIPDVFFWTVP